MHENNNKMLSLQSLRAIAAILVVFHHNKDFSVKYGFTNQMTDFLHSGIGAFGVDVFFVISGFIMYYTTYVSGNKASFLTKRLVRVVPLYWLFTIILGLLLFCLPQLFGSLKFDLFHLLLSMSFIPHNSPQGDYLPLLGVGWTLCFELYFYFIFSLLLSLEKEKFLWVISFIMLLFPLLAFVHPEISSWNRMIWMLANTLNFEFLFGILIAFNYQKIMSFFSRGLFFSGVLFVVFGFAFAYYVCDHEYRLQFRGIVWGIPAALVVFGFVLLSRFKFPKFLVVLGDSSYSLYLSHILLLPLLWKMINFLKLNVDLNKNISLAVSIGVVSISVILSCLIYFIIEKPMTRKISSFWVRPLNVPSNYIKIT